MAECRFSSGGPDRDIRAERERSSEWKQREKEETMTTDGFDLIIQWFSDSN